MKVCKGMGDGDGERSAPCTFFAVLLLLHKPTTRTAFTSAHGFPLRLLILGLAEIQFDMVNHAARKVVRKFQSNS